jgi:hypothetical protein
VSATSQRGRAELKIEEKLEAMGLELPSPLQAPPGIEFPFAWVRVRGNRLAGSREVGAHAHSSIGMALPLNAPVVCEAEVEIDSQRAAPRTTKAPTCGAFAQCAEEDSNLHPVIPDQALNLARLPIPPSARVRAAV